MRQKTEKSRDILSAREMECIYYLLHGMTAKEIGLQLELSTRTVESYLESIKIKLGCRNKTQLIIVLTKLFL